MLNTIIGFGFRITRTVCRIRELLCAYDSKYNVVSRLIKPRTQDQVRLDKYLGSFTCSCVQVFPRNFSWQVLFARVYSMNWQVFPCSKAGAFAQCSLSRKNLSIYAVNLSRNNSHGRVYGLKWIIEFVLFGFFVLALRKLFFH